MTQQEVATCEELRYFQSGVVVVVAEFLQKRIRGHEEPLQVGEGLFVVQQGLDRWHRDDAQLLEHFVELRPFLVESQQCFNSTVLPREHGLINDRRHATNERLPVDRVHVFGRQQRVGLVIGPVPLQQELGRSFFYRQHRGFTESIHDVCTRFVRRTLRRTTLFEFLFAQQ